MNAMQRASMEESMDRTSKAMAALLAACAAWTAWPAGAQNAATREQDAATQRQARETEGANRAARVADETGEAAQAARTEQAEARQYEAAQNQRSGTAAPPAWGPVLEPRGRQAADPVRKDPAEVHDETDSLARQSSQQTAQQTRQQTPEQSEPQRKQTIRPAPARHPAWQASGPMAPRPLRSAETAPSTGVPIPPSVTAPQPVVPNSSVVRGCQGGLCTDAGGNSFTNPSSGNAGTSSSGRLCTRTGVTVQCF
jgi:hypothetical protein